MTPFELDETLTLIMSGLIEKMVENTCIIRMYIIVFTLIIL